MFLYLENTQTQKVKPTPHTLLDLDVGTKVLVFANKAYLFLLSGLW